MKIWKQQSLLPFLLLLIHILSSYTSAEIKFCSQKFGEGQRLNATVYRKVFSLSAFDCMALCVSDKCCRATNYEKSARCYERENCEILYEVETDTDIPEEGLEINLNFNYLKLRQPERKFDCNCSPCKNGGICAKDGNKSCVDCPVGHVGKRCEKIDCINSSAALGMENGEISNNQIQASSEYGPVNIAQYGRLNFQRAPGQVGSWSAGVNDPEQWLQVDFELRIIVSEILTQGGDKWVKSYTVSYSKDGIYFQEYKINGIVKVFPGNNNQTTVVRNTVSPVIVTRFIRINPKTYQERISMRVEFVGCMKDCINGSALGMENGEISDNQIIASSVWSDNHTECVAQNGRLNFQLNFGSWCAHSYDTQPWLQIDFKHETIVSEILTQGRYDSEQWVKKYTVSYSRDGNNFQDYKMNGVVKVFPGNNDRNTIVRNAVSPVIVTRFIRINPKDRHNHISMRVEFVGCMKGVLNASHILNGNVTYMGYLAKWLNHSTWWRTRLCYRATQHGWQTNVFHERCDHKGATVTIVRVEDYIFGGYSDISWGGNIGFRETVNSFLFSLRNKDNLAPFKAPVLQNKKHNAIFTNPGYGPTFGDEERDLYIADNAIKKSYSNFGNSYQLPSGYTDNTGQAKALLAGSASFKLTEVEVFYFN